MMTYPRMFFGLLVALMITSCSGQSEQQQLSLADTAQLIDKAGMSVTTEQLSDIIIKRQNNYLLFDVRPEAQYRAGQIKTAENLSGSRLLTAERIATLTSGRNIYLYSATSDQAAQLAALLRTQDIPAFYLQGGYQAWSGEIQQSAGAGSADDQARKQAVSCWFEGDYVAEAGLAVKGSQQSGGYVPPLEPVAAPAQEDALGLGLGLGLGPEDATEPAPAAEDTLGLGLGLGLGPEDAIEAEASPPSGKLRIGEGC